MCSVLVVIGFFFYLFLWIVGAVIITPDRTKNKREASLLNHSSLAPRMAADVVRISEVHKFSRGWTTLVHVVEADRPRISPMEENARTYRRFVFADSQGVRVSVVVYDGDISCVEGLLLPFRKYYISGAKVHEMPEDQPVGSYQFFWVINKKTQIRETSDDGGPAIPPYFGLRSYRSLHFVADTDTYINVMGIVVGGLPRRSIYFRGCQRLAKEFVIASQCGCPLLLTLWDEYGAIEGKLIEDLMSSNPVIIGVRLRVTTDNYLSLTTQPSSVIMINPDVPEVTRLNHWFDSNSSAVIHMFCENSFRNPVLLLPPVRDPTLTAISDVASSTKFDRGTAWIRGEVQIWFRMNRLWYLACPHCYEPYDFVETLGIVCLFCGREMYNFPRACIALSIKDTSGSMNVLALGDEAEKLIGLTAFHLYEVDGQENARLCGLVGRQVKGKKLLCNVKHSFDSIRKASSVNFTIVHFYPA